VIVTHDPAFASSVASLPEWQNVPAVAEGRVLLAPPSPFGFVEHPPSVNRLIGLRWLLHRLYPEQMTGDLREEVRAFYALFYRTDLDDGTLDALLGG
jgi:iron complex transport system substrate-binding protein